MSGARGKVTDGKIVLDAPAGWPDGTEVVVRRADEANEDDDLQGDDPESIERWIAWLDSIQPLILTPEDEARIEAAQKAQKEFELATWEERAEKARRMWE